MRGKNNKGFSYVEMLMVLAVIAIMIGMVTISVGLIGRTNTRRTSEKLETLANKARTSAMTQGTNKGYLCVAEYRGAVYAYVGSKIAEDNPAEVKQKGIKICSNDMEIRMPTDSDPGSGSFTSDGLVHRISFKQSTGGLANGVNLIEIIVRKKGTSKTSSFSIFKQTGKINRIN